VAEAGLAKDKRFVTPDGRTLAEQVDLVVDRCVQMRRDIDTAWENRVAPDLAGMEFASSASRISKTKLEPA
jgi:hypothetical protein